MMSIEHATPLAEDQALLNLLEGPEIPKVYEPPIIFDFGRPEDVAKFKALYEERRITSYGSRAADIGNELFELENPGQKANARLRGEYMQKVYAQGPAYGRWVLFQNGDLGHYPKEEDLLALLAAANPTSQEHQQRFWESSVIVAGLSVGSEAAKQLAIMGVGRMALLDPDVLAFSNLNRIRASAMHVGHWKAIAAANEIHRRNPYIDLEVFTEGFTSESGAQLRGFQFFVEEMDSPGAKIEGRGFAAAEGPDDEAPMALVSAADWDDVSIVDVERHDLGPTPPFLDRMSAADLAKTEWSGMEPLHFIEKLVGMECASTRLEAGLERFADRERACAPQSGTTAALGGLLVARTIGRIIAGEEVPSGRYAVSSRLGLHALLYALASDLQANTRPAWLDIE